MQCADIAQLVEHILGKDEVTGSNPVISLKFLFKKSPILRILRDVGYFLYNYVNSSFVLYLSFIE